MVIIYRTTAGTRNRVFTKKQHGVKKGDIDKRLGRRLNTERGTRTWIIEDYFEANSKLS